MCSRASWPSKTTSTAIPAWRRPVASAMASLAWSSITSTLIAKPPATSTAQAAAGQRGADRSRMPDRVLQNHYCVAAVQHQLSYNGPMSLPTSNAGNAPVASRRGAPSSRRARPRFRRAGLAMATLLGTGMLATACGIVHSSEQVVGFPGHALGVPGHALAFVNCMRTHGEPNMPEPVVDGNSVHITIKVGSGVDPASPRFAAAFKACKYL